MDTSHDRIGSPRHFSEGATGAVIALIRVIELYDPAVAHWAALRVEVTDRLLDQMDEPLPSTDRVEMLAAVALADVDLTISRPADPEAAHEPTRTMLAATLVGRLAGLRNVSTSIAHRRDRWDEMGANIPLGARLIAVTDTLVGNPAAGYVPTWTNARRRVRRNREKSLDPALCDALSRCEFEDIEAAPIPSASIHDRLLTYSEPQPDPGAETATTIRSAVAAAGETSQLMHLFASTAQRTINAAEVLVYQFGETHLDEAPLARATDGQQPFLDDDRLGVLDDFSTQAELRAGIALAPTVDDISNPPTDIDLDNDMIVPLTVGESTWGVLIASRRPDDAPFDAHDLSVLRHVASEAALAASKTNHWAEIEAMALRDQLTGLGNRHGLYRVLDAIFERPPVERLDCALIMCDVDGLKVVNDTLGHQAGDRLLKDAASALRGAIRSPERTTVCRIGGDEFCMVIDGGALLTAHEISDMIERLFARSAGSGPPRSISCGIAFVTEEITNRSALLRAADENQYQTKRARKAQIAEDLAELQAAGTAPPDRRSIRD